MTNDELDEVERLLRAAYLAPVCAAAFAELRAERDALWQLLRRAQATMSEVPSPPYPWEEIVGPCRAEGEAMMQKGKCVNFNGIQNAACRAGVAYEGLARPLCCIFPKSAKDCSLYLDPTPEQVAADNADFLAAMERMCVVMTAIQPWRKKHKGQSFGEVIECPVCKGRLHLSISSYNGHVHGKCETTGCVSWME